MSDFFKNVNERITNPLFFSFILAWLVFNWKIIIILIYYKPADLKSPNYSAYLDFISAQINNANNLYYPLLVAGVYTFIFPFLKNCIYAFNTWIYSWGNTWNLKMSKGSKVSINKYMSLREIYEDRTKLLSEIIEKESNFLNENEVLRNNVSQLANEKNMVNIELDKWKNIDNVNILNGNWEFFYTANPESGKFLYKMNISGGLISIFDNLSTKNQKKTIVNFYKSPSSQQLRFTVSETGNFSDGSKYVYHFYLLDIFDDFKLLKGTEDEQLTVQFKKVF